MPHKSEGGRAKKGRGTKPERKAARRAAAQEGQGPLYPRRTDRATPGEGKRRMGPRR
jgi:hypothetical protein